MAERLRGMCSRCGRQFVVRRDGMIRMHELPALLDISCQPLRAGSCPGSGKSPMEAEHG